MVAGIVGLVMTHRLFSLSPIVIAVQIAAAALMIWARVTFGRRSYHFAANPTQGELVTWGPYRFIRHPIYSSVCIFTLAGVAANMTWLAALFAGIIVASAMVRLRCEESLLSVQYPEYASYKARTWRLLPYVY
jgi:protein-S-isoprenylcysteine O-methyltransferase Ste14